MISIILSGIVGLYNVFLNVLLFSFNLSYFAGQVIVLSLLTIFSVIDNLFSSIKMLFVVLYEDCQVFLSDVASTFSLMGEALWASAEALGQTLKYLCSSLFLVKENLCGLCEFIAHGFYRVLFVILNTTLSGFVLLKDSVILLGSTSWSIFVFIPSKILVIKENFVSLALFCMKEIRNIIFNFKSHLRIIFYDILSFFTDIPQESVYGICLSLILGWMLLKYWRNIYPSCVRYLGCAIHQSHRTLLTAWNYLETFTLWLLTNQTNTAPSNTFNYPTVTGNAAGGENPQGTADAGVNKYVQRGVGSIPQMPEEDNGKYFHEQEDRLCVVCQDVERSTIILPCRHVCLCQDCCVTIRRTHGRCPVCRHAVRRTMRVFI